MGQEPRVALEGGLEGKVPNRVEGEGEPSELGFAAAKDASGLAACGVG